MSQVMTSPVAEVGHVDPARSSGFTNALGHVGVAHALLSIAEMDRVLATAAFGALTQALLDTLSVNDKQRRIVSIIEEGTAVTTDLIPPAVSNGSDPTNEVHPYGTAWKNTVSNAVFQTPGDGTWVQVAA